MATTRASKNTKTYKKNFLTQVIYKLDFAPSVSVSEEALKEYKKTLGENYSDLSNILQKGLLIQGDLLGITTEQNESTVWRIDSKDNSHVIEIENKSFAIVVKNYKHYKYMRSIVEISQSLFFSQFLDITQINRVGLRYIDQIKLEKTKNIDWSDYINKKLTEHLNFSDRNKIRRSMHAMVLAHDEDTQINFNFGIFNNYFPAPILTEEFILDFDAFTTFAVHREETLNILDNFNAVLTDYFEKAITDKLRQLMGV